MLARWETVNGAMRGRGGLRRCGRGGRRQGWAPWMRPCGSGLAPPRTHRLVRSDLTHHGWHARTRFSLARYGAQARLHMLARADREYWSTVSAAAAASGALALAVESGW